MVFHPTNPEPALLNTASVPIANVWERAIFVGWHYSMGSAFTSPFWDYAAQNYARQMELFHEERTRERFERFLDEGRRAVPEQ